MYKSEEQMLIHLWFNDLSIPNTVVDIGLIPSVTHSRCLTFLPARHLRKKKKKIERERPIIKKKKNLSRKQMGCSLKTYSYLGPHW